MDLRQEFTTDYGDRCCYPLAVYGLYEARIALRRHINAAPVAMDTADGWLYQSFWSRGPGQI